LYLPAPLTETVEEKTMAPVQVASSGPNRSKVIVPPGVKPPASVAVSEIGLPRVTGPEAFVTIVGVALVTTKFSLGAPQGLVTALLAPSPL
jgi:hypothetical protein